MTSTVASDSNLTEDHILGGRVRLLQPRKGYRAGLDAVLLAAAIPAQSGQSALELGAGTGAVLLCLMARVPGLDVTGVELQEPYAQLARQNCALNGAAATILQADLRSLPADVKQRRFDHVFANPPYFDRAKGSASPDSGRDTAFGGDTDVEDWIDTASRRLAPKGWLTLIQKVERLPAILAAVTPRLGSVTILPLAGREGRAADRFILWARKEGRGAFHLAAPLILHDGPIHLRDAEDYSAPIRAILRDAAPLIRPA